MIKQMNNGQWVKALVMLSHLFEKVDHQIHMLGCVAIEYGSRTFDANRMKELYKAFGNSGRKQGFLVWVNMFSPIRITETTKNGITSVTCKLAKPEDKDYAPWDVIGAEARPFWTLEEAKETIAKPLSADAFLKLIYAYKNKYTKAKTEGKYPIEGNSAQLEALIDNTLADATRRKAQLEAPAPASQPVLKVRKPQVPQQVAA